MSKFIPEFDKLFLALQTVSADRLTGSAVAAALRTLQMADAPQEELAAVLWEVVEYLESLPESAKPEWRRALQYLFLLIHHKRDPAEQAELNRLMIEMMEADREEVSKMAVTSAEVLIATGRKQGHKEGHTQGKIEGQNEILLELLAVKFGSLSQDTIAAVNALSDRRAHDVARQVLTATTLAELGL